LGKPEADLRSVDYLRRARGCAELPLRGGDQRRDSPTNRTLCKETESTAPSLPACRKDGVTPPLAAWRRSLATPLCWRPHQNAWQIASRRRLRAWAARLLWMPANGSA